MLIAADGISIVFQRPDGSAFEAVREVSIEVKRGERLIILGASGCGKSTLLKVLGGFVRPTLGTVKLRSEVIRGPNHRVIMIFQEFDQLFPWKTVRHNLMFAMNCVFGGANKTRAQVDALLQHVGLEQFADAFPHTLSGGMKQRAAIARGMILEPDVMLMDEPFAALDALNRRRMQELLLKICAEREQTIIFVSHSIEEALLLGTRIVLMAANPGRVHRSYDMTASNSPNARQAIADEIRGQLDDQTS